VTAETRDRPRRSIRQRFLLIAVAGGLLAVAAVMTVAVINERMREALADESRSIRDEQRIANDIIGGVMRQLVTVSSMAEGADSSLRREFDAAGAVVFEGLQTYLFRNLNPQQRLQIETVKEGYQRMEVSALRASRLQAMQDGATAALARQETMRHGLDLLGALEGFLRLREADLERLERRQAVILRTVWVGGGGLALLVGLLLSLLIARFLGRQVTRPLGELAAATTRIGAGELSTRVPVDYDHEFHILATSFNQMAGQLATAQQSLADRNAALEGALEQVRLAQEEVVQSEKLSAVGRMTAGLAHELNNPLASVLGFSELLASEVRERAVLPADVAAGYIEPIVREATRARLLIRSLLQFARRAGAEIGPVSLRGAMEVATRLRRHAFEQAGLRLELAPIPAVAVLAEEQQLQSVFINIMNNALDAMEPAGQGTLRIRAAAVAGLVTVEFEDEGPGMAQPDRVFEPFYTTKEVGQGTGLGLALAQRFIESFGGTLRALNLPDRGARVTLQLREAPTDAVRDAGSEAAATLPAPARTATGRTVLVVEDEPHLQRLVAQLLGRIGVRALVAGTAAEGRALLAREVVDAIVSDVKMPGESGLDFHRWVEREHPALVERFLFMTGDVDTPDLAEIAETRPRSLIRKPFAVAELLARVQEVLGTGGEE
jgi:C4-dicarboxylate-specific signal transduction histidine kinase/CheY-like chemotaxis protein